MVPLWQLRGVADRHDLRVAPLWQADRYAPLLVSLWQD